MSDDQDEIRIETIPIEHDFLQFRIWVDEQIRNPDRWSDRPFFRDNLPAETPSIFGPRKDTDE